MVSAFDQRIVKAGIELTPGNITQFEGISIYATGRKFGSALQNQCNLTLYNLSADQQNYVLTQSSPLKIPRTPVNVTLDVGRESYGTFRLFEGYVIGANVTQPPDIGITLQSLTNNYATGTIIANNQPAISLLSQICKTIASSMSLSLLFKATDRQINNWSFAGSAQHQIDKLNQVGAITAFIDNTTLVVLNNSQYRSDNAVIISASTGMVGVPQVTDYGVIVKTMVNNEIELGSAVTIESAINPAANGTYRVIQINFDIASRDTPFWYTLSCLKLAYALQQ